MREVPGFMCPLNSFFLHWSAGFLFFFLNINIYDTVYTSTSVQYSTWLRNRVGYGLGSGYYITVLF
jgi:hypothetical protein